MSFSEQYRRPDGFPFSENEFRAHKQEQMQVIIDGGMDEQFDEWVLRGRPGVSPVPTVALGIFPTLVTSEPGFIFESEVLIMHENHRPLGAYWAEAVSLPITERVLTFEAEYFSLARGVEQELFMDTVAYCMELLLPTGIILFGHPGAGVEEYAYMISPRATPPSATYRHLIEQIKASLPQ